MPTASQTQSYLAVGFEQAFGEVFALGNPNATDQVEPIRNRILARMSLNPAHEVHTHETMLSHQWKWTASSQTFQKKLSGILLCYAGKPLRILQWFFSSHLSTCLAAEKAMSSLYRHHWPVIVRLSVTQ